MTLHIPIRVFLLSGSRLLCEALGRVMGRTDDILVVGACPYSVDAPMEIVESMCDVLLADSGSVRSLDSQIHDDRRCSLPRLNVVMIEMDDNSPTFSKHAQLSILRSLSKEAAVADIISTIRGVANGETNYPSQFPLMRCPRGILTPGHSDV
jgi:DNA-binding NarL/FixJ family response regulator